MKPIIQFTSVKKEYKLQTERTMKDLIPQMLSLKPSPTHTVFSDLSFSLQAGQSVGIIGRNGVGKSTLLKLIAGVTYPTSGNVIVKGKVAPLIELGAGFHHELTGYENISLNAAILGMHKKEIELVRDQIIAFSELEEAIHQPVKRYSSGMYMRLGFSVAVHSLAPILLIDEVLAVGDKPFQEKCLRKLEEQRNLGKTIVFISHDETAVQGFCERVILLHEGRILFDGAAGSAIQEYHRLSSRTL